MQELANEKDSPTRKVERLVRLKSLDSVWSCPCDMRLGRLLSKSWSAPQRRQVKKAVQPLDFCFSVRGQPSSQRSLRQWVYARNKA